MGEILKYANITDFHNNSADRIEISRGPDTPRGQYFANFCDRLR